MLEQKINYLHSKSNVATKAGCVGGDLVCVCRSGGGGLLIT